MLHILGQPKTSWAMALLRKPFSTLIDTCAAIFPIAYFMVVMATENKQSRKAMAQIGLTLMLLWLLKMLSTLGQLHASLTSAL